MTGNYGIGNPAEATVKEMDIRSANLAELHIHERRVELQHRLGKVSYLNVLTLAGHDGDANHV
jgi:hypothetical protein